MAKTVPSNAKNVRGIKPIRIDARTAHQVTRSVEANEVNRMDLPRHRSHVFDWTFAREPARTRSNLLIMGASGHVAQAFLQRLAARRADFGRVVLLDPDDSVLRNAYVDHALLDYEFVQRKLQFPEDTADYHRLLQRHDSPLIK